ncbi:hypothetical protein KORDIASMS9_04334 [Kordia sp. SMS9]|uniref:hypothetical protein n=1 Tax=Kordia sp. SMS9 TaxID=2282170 RepID=UPI000E0D4597|nr:hypothetical protein [Kordia sp. SMS9]AXG72072.1 hypothetical protein KORDIASMS9_04334 [Kordia sp. SMS9]
MQFKKILFFLCICVSVNACKEVDPNKQFDEGNYKDQLYVSKEIGWQLKVPKGWEIITKSQKDDYSQKGKKVFKDVHDMDVDDSSVKDLIAFKKDKYNIFLSNSESFKETYEGEWKESSANLKSILYDTYKSKGINVDSMATITERIDGLDFERIGFVIYGSDGEVILNQLYYRKLINGVAFNVILNYNNEKDKRIMQDALFSSKFRK